MEHSTRHGMQGATNGMPFDALGPTFLAARSHPSRAKRGCHGGANGDYIQKVDAPFDRRPSCVNRGGGLPNSASLKRDCIGQVRVLDEQVESLCVFGEGVDGDGIGKVEALPLPEVAHPSLHALRIRREKHKRLGTTHGVEHVQLEQRRRLHLANVHVPLGEGHGHLKRLAVGPRKHVQVAFLHNDIEDLTPQPPTVARVMAE
ncbi:hypothetical protein H310_12687 [Aphanomyces invadans]|uniref:Uncharacterized protein n=1 Tax=Aphanomyces invadans TaxID=157072 RepID=A0A024TGG2_9STRA|nr:hypothetical protein H310_12687 [Aphanomyces invadans]ETV93250.1 hypothetical protein H310_12687 [Aphanomyces invadans]|eukprot:XP_008878085.1 hypothetical protein H310_12687 [Aphanomyces invadans]